MSLYKSFTSPVSVHHAGFALCRQMTQTTGLAVSRPATLVTYLQELRLSVTSLLLVAAENIAA